MAEKPEVVADARCALGEGPLWHPLERKLYWIDIVNGELLRYDPASGIHEKVYRGGVIGGFTIQADGGLLLFMAEGAIANWRAGKLSVMRESSPDHRGFRFNDAIADPTGRVFSGTLVMKESHGRSRRAKWIRRLRRLATAFRHSLQNESQPGRLYRLELDGALTEILPSLGRPNGMGFSPDHKRMYITDSAARTIYAHDYREKGEIGHSRVFAQLAPGEGTPDGLTVDAEGGVWSARWGGACVVRYSEGGIETARIELPAKNVTSVTFGGDDYADLYITTAGGGGQPVEEPLAGAVFRLRPEIGGVPECLSRVELQARSSADERSLD